jgi:hypothetical protein
MSSTINLNLRTILLVSKLAMERCQQQLAHLHALMHLSEPSDFGLDGVAAESARTIISNIEKELRESARMLEIV